MRAMSRLQEVEKVNGTAVAEALKSHLLRRSPASLFARHLSHVSSLILSRPLATQQQVPYEVPTEIITGSQHPGTNNCWTSLPVPQARRRPTRPYTRRTGPAQDWAPPMRGSSPRTSALLQSLQLPRAYVEEEQQDYSVYRQHHQSAASCLRFVGEESDIRGVSITFQ